MPITSIGTDILLLPRLEQLIQRRGKERLAKRILSSKEKEEYQNLFPSPPDTSKIGNKELLYLGTRWCVKEAVYKALYPIHLLEWNQVSVVKHAGKPQLEILNSSLYGIQRSHTSLSHDGDYIISYVVLEGE
ncbi:4'-phosphopantetheinyl transferase [Pilobolus umbonatus]|nr:4'-phosphopantetheinyl transferase [Pilobolus umbonatus]